MAVTNNVDAEQDRDEEENQSLTHGGEVADRGAAEVSAQGGEGGSAWPDNWRDLMAGGDEKFRKQLDRYHSPTDVGKKGRELEAKFSSGEYRRDLPRDATPQQLAEWKRERGLPEGVEGYLDNLTLPDGVVLGDSDRPMASGFAEAAFRANISQDQFAGMVSQYYAMQDKVAADRAEADAVHRAQTVAALREEFGADTKRVVTSVNNMLKTWPGDIANQLLSARDPDTGRMLGDNPALIRQLAMVARELNPTSTLIPASGGSRMKGVEEQLADIRKLRQENPDQYDADQDLQARELDLLDAQARGKARGRR